MINDCEGTAMIVILVVTILLIVCGGALGVAKEQNFLKEEICVNTQAQVSDYLACKQMRLSDIISKMEVKIENSEK